MVDHDGGRVALREYLGEAHTLARIIRRFARYRPQGKRNVPELLEVRAREQGARTAIVFAEAPPGESGRRHSYADWNAYANRVAHWAHERGLRHGDVVALLMENRPEFLFVWSGLAKLGVVTALVNTNLSGRMLDHAFAAAQPALLIAGAECLPQLATATQAPSTYVLRDRSDFTMPPRAEDLDHALAQLPDTNPDPRWRKGLRAGDDLLYIYTSGTTGAPKAARFSHLRFLTTGDALSVFTETTPDDVLYDVLPLYHSAGGVIVPALALFSGATLVLRRKFSASHFWDDVRRHGVTGFQYIGELCRYLLAHPADPRDGQHRLRFALGNGLRPDVWPAFRDRFGIPNIHEFYAATEGNVVLLNLDNEVGAVGRVLIKPVSNARIIRYDVADDAHPRDRKGFCIEVERGETGEMIGRLPFSKRMALGRFEGYTSGPDSEKKLLHDVFRKGDAWFRTGDLLRQDARGYFYFVDRIGDTYRWKGENVSTQEVAELLGPFPGVHMANVYGVKVGDRDGRAGMVALLMDPGVRFDGERFYAFVAERLPRYAEPAFVRLQTEADLTGTFKLRKVDLQKQGFDPAVVREPLFVRDDRARAYVPVTAEVHASILAGDWAL